MNTRNQPPGKQSGKRSSNPPVDAIASGSGVASAKHQGLRRPADDERVEDALPQVGLDDRGDVLEDQLRDRHSKGVADGYDDSLDNDADTGSVQGADTAGQRKRDDA